MECRSLTAVSVDGWLGIYDERRAVVAGLARVAGADRRVRRSGSKAT